MTETDSLPTPTPAHIDSLKGLYLHVPFCVHKCPYCDFASGPAEGDRRKHYLDALTQEIETTPWRGAAPQTLYFGGGTPSELSANEWGEILNALHSTFELHHLIEFTVECNPGTLSAGKLAVLRNSGVNRLSLGVQSFNNRHLSELGRIHDSGCARDSIQLAQDQGFSNLSLDLMFGLPGQTLSEWKADLQEAVRLSPLHLSLYTLTLEPGTPFFDLKAKDKLAPMDQDGAADMFEYCMDYCSINSYQQYELSSYCRENLRSLHNLLYWTNSNYVGLGVSAASHVDGHRWANTRNQDRYTSSCLTSRPELEYLEFRTPRQRASEEIILRLRLNQGADLVALSDAYELPLLQAYREQIEKLQELALIDAENGALVLTRRGRLLASEVAYYFLA